MSGDYSGSAGRYISGPIATKRASGYSYETAEYHLRRFDRCCALHAGSGGLSRQLVLGWAKCGEQESA